MTSKQKWAVYILECSDGTLYTGITNNLVQRLVTHNTGKHGAKYTKARRPVKVVYTEEYPTKSKVLKREHAIKQLTRAEKLKLITSPQIC